MNVEILAVRGLLERTSAEFRSELVAMCERLGADPSYVAAVMSLETGASFDPAIRNPASGATGLIQFMPSTAKNLGTTVDELARLSAVSQLAFVELYFAKVGRRLVTPTDHYLAVFSPAFIGKPPGTAMYAAPAIAYEQNKGLDGNRDGVITVGDVGAKIEGIVATARAKPRISVSPVTRGGKALTVVALGGIAYLAWRWFHV